MIKIFIGYDPNETVAYHVLSHSILELASEPVSITPIKLEHIKSFFDRERVREQSTEFSFSRFLTPYLSGYQGWSIFMDCDFLCLDDVARLYACRDTQYDVMVVKHDHKPKERVKFLGALQTQYEKKNWSSLMLFNNKRCTRLTPEYVNTASGLQLHQFHWCTKIGALNPAWNHLVGYDQYNPVPKMVHFTEGGPYFDEYRDCEYANDWFAAKARMEHATQREESGAA